METISKTYFQYILKVANTYGISDKELYLNMNIKNNRIEVIDVKSSIEYIIEKSGNINIPLEIGKRFKLNDTHSLMKAIKYAKTIHSVLKILEEFHLLIHTGISLKICIEDEFILELDYKDSLIQNIRFPAEGFLAIYLNMIRGLSKQKIIPKRVCFFHGRHNGKDELDKFFGIDVEFNQEKNYMVFDKSILDFYLDSYDKTLENMYIINSKVEYDKLDFDSFYNKLKLYISDNLFPNISTINSTAEAFYISPRTLQYRLKEHNLKFNTILNEIRKEKSMEMLHKGIPLFSISMLLGFKNQSAFTRAFKKWYGVTPSNYSLYSFHLALKSHAPLHLS